MNVDFVDKSSRRWVSADKKVGQDAEGKGSGLEWGTVYYVANSVESLKNNTKSYWVLSCFSSRYWAREQQNNNQDYSTIVWDRQFW